MPEVDSGIEYPTGSHINNVRIGLISNDFLIETEEYPFVFGSLTRNSSTIGYYALTPRNFFLGANQSVSRIDRGLHILSIRSCSRQKLEDRIRVAPNITVAETFHRMGNLMVIHSQGLDITTIRQEFLLQLATLG